MRFILVFVGFIALFIVVVLFHGSAVIPLPLIKAITSVHDKKHNDFDTLSYLIQHEEALNFCKKKKFNTTYCVLADMNRHSGLPRLFIWNFKDTTIAKSILVSHGCGKNPWGLALSKTNPIFSNVPESHCSSLGKYKIGERGASQWGIKVKYLMHGLDTSNNNALKRAIVLHAWEAVENTSTYPKGTPEGWGCPAVSNDGMHYLDSLFKTSKTPVLFWQFYD